MAGMLLSRPFQLRSVPNLNLRKNCCNFVNCWPNTMASIEWTTWQHSSSFGLDEIHVVQFQHDETRTAATAARCCKMLQDAARCCKMLQDAARCCKLQMLQEAPRLIVLQIDGDHETASDVQIVQELAVTCWICCLNWNPWNRLEPLVRNLPQTGSEHNQTHPKPFQTTGTLK